MRKWKHLIWTSNVYIQNFLGERGIWPEEESLYDNKVGYAPTKEVKDTMESFYIQQMFYRNR